jgi:hypothetical protein
MNWINLAQRLHTGGGSYKYDHVNLGYIETWEFIGQEVKSLSLDTDFAPRI